MINYWKKINHFFTSFRYKKLDYYPSYGMQLDNLALQYGIERKLFEIDSKLRKRLLKIFKDMLQ